MSEPRGDYQHPHLDALVGELMADRDRHKALSEHRLNLLNEAHRHSDRERHARDADRLLTKNEAVSWLTDGSLPDNFALRLSVYVERYECFNCDGQEGGIDHNGEWSCPDCSPPKSDRGPDA